MKDLVIVESPTKSRTLSKFLGNKYLIEASMGHVRDLPKSDLGVDVENNFEPTYIVPKDKIKRVNQLKKILSSATTLWLATDPDREGEAIAWHIKELLENNKGNKVGKKLIAPVIKRVVFHEITPIAVREAFDHPRDLDIKLVNAQQARRILDRIVGYKISPILWRKVKSGLSAGRVQSVALRLIVERDQEIKKFITEEYWTIESNLKSRISNQENKFLANLVGINNKKIKITNQPEAQTHEQLLKEAIFKVSKITQKETKRYPAAPFTTSTMQQTSANRFGMTAKKTMSLAQQLYERGLITYMRTDSFNLSTQALSLSREYILNNFGNLYLPKSPKTYRTKSKLAQEAHEAIRPTNPNLTPAKFNETDGLGRDHQRLYELIWKRTIASQMNETILDNTAVEIEATTKNGIYNFKANGSVIKFDGWLKLYSKLSNKLDERNKFVSDKEDDEEEKILPILSKGEILDLINIIPLQHFTDPQPRFNEASLIKKLEELGIGRPSTYASILSTITDRYYVERIDKKMFPTELGIAVNKFLVTYFPNIVDYTFTALMEDKLDEIAQGKLGWVETLREFYTPFAQKVIETENEAQRVNIEPEIVDRKCPECGSNLVVRFGKYGKFLACLKFPECKHTENLAEKLNIPCPLCQGEIVTKKTRKNRIFYGCKNYPKCNFASWTKPEVKVDKITT